MVSSPETRKHIRCNNSHKHTHQDTNMHLIDVGPCPVALGCIFLVSAILSYTSLTAAVYNTSDLDGLTPHMHFKLVECISHLKVALSMLTVVNYVLTVDRIYLT